MSAMKICVLLALGLAGVLAAENDRTSDLDASLSAKLAALTQNTAASQQGHRKVAETHVQAATRKLIERLQAIEDADKDLSGIKLPRQSLHRALAAGVVYGGYGGAVPPTYGAYGGGLPTTTSPPSTISSSPSLVATPLYAGPLSFVVPMVVTFNAPCTILAGADQQAAFVAAVQSSTAQGLGVTADHVNVTQVMCGSVVAGMNLLVDPSMSNATVLDMLTRLTTTPNTIYSSAFLQAFGITGVSASTPLPLSSLSDSTSRATPAVTGTTPPPMLSNPGNAASSSATGNNLLTLLMAVVASGLLRALL